MQEDNRLMDKTNRTIIDRFYISQITVAVKFCIFNISASKQVIFLYVILSEVELLLSEERGRSARRKPPRDLVTNLGGLLRGCNIFCGKPPKFVRRSHRRYRSSVLDRIVACGSLPHQNFDFGLRPSLRMTDSGIVLLLSLEAGRQGRRPLQCKTTLLADGVLAVPSRLR